uniref:tsukushi n=1 Tax=Myxine glutinosa TaxID=7769 RepID=UPI00358F7266
MTCIMPVFISQLLLLPLLLLDISRTCCIRNDCLPVCRCHTLSYGPFESLRLTHVDCSDQYSNSGGKQYNASIPKYLPLDSISLDLSSNRISALRSGMLHGPGYTTLKTLDLSRNPLEHLGPNVLSGLFYLDFLNLSHTGLQVLDLRMLQRLSLSDLDLSHNRLQNVSLDTFVTGRIGRPLTLRLSDNGLTFIIRHTGSTIPNLRFLDLSQNLLSVVPSHALKGLPLRHLDLSENFISTLLPKAFDGLPELIHLNLRAMRGQLSSVSHRAFSGLRNLHEMDISGNPALAVLSPNIFQGLHSLRDLRIAGTGLDDMPSETLSKLPALQLLSVGNTSFICSKLPLIYLKLLWTGFAQESRVAQEGVTCHVIYPNGDHLGINKL